MRKIVVIGIGNTCVTDDAVGILVVREIERRISDPRLTFVELAAGSFEVLDFLQGCDDAVIVDAAKAGVVPAGQVRVYPESVLRDRNTPNTLHAVDFQSLLGLGSLLGLKMPQTVTMFAVEVEDAETFNEGCTQSVAAAIPEIADRVIEHLRAEIPDLRFTQHNKEVCHG